MTNTPVKIADRTERVLFCLIVAGCILRVLAVALANPLDHLFSDPQRHWENGARFLHPTLMGAVDPFLYQLYLFIVRRLTGDARAGLWLVTSILSLLVPYTWYRFSREVLATKNQALLSCSLITWIPSFVGIYCFFMTETLLMPLLGLSLWLTARAERKGSLSAFLVCGLSWGLTAQTRIIGLALGTFCLIYLVWSTRKWLRLIPALVIIFALAIPQARRSQEVLGFSAPFGFMGLNELVFISGGKATKLILGENGAGGYLEYSNPALYIDPFFPFVAWNSSRTGTEEARIDLKHGRQDWDNEYQRFRAKNREKLSRFFFENLAFFFGSHSWPDSGKEGIWWRVSLVARLIWAPLIIFNLFMGGYLLLRKRINLLALSTLFMTIVLASQFTSIFEGRYRKPLELLLIVCTVYFIGYLTSRKNLTSLEVISHDHPNTNRRSLFDPDYR